MASADPSLASFGFDSTRLANANDVLRDFHEIFPNADINNCLNDADIRSSGLPSAINGKPNSPMPTANFISWMQKCIERLVNDDMYESQRIADLGKADALLRYYPRDIIANLIEADAFKSRFERLGLSNVHFINEKLKYRGRQELDVICEITQKELSLGASLSSRFPNEVRSPKAETLFRYRELELISYNTFNLEKLREITCNLPTLNEIKIEKLPYLSSRFKDVYNGLDANARARWVREVILEFGGEGIFSVSELADLERQILTHFDSVRASVQYDESTYFFKLILVTSLLTPNYLTR